MSRGRIVKRQNGAGGRTRTDKGLPPANFESAAVTVSPHPLPRTRNTSTPHPTDQAIVLKQWRRSLDDEIVEAQITLPDGSIKILSTKQRDIMKAAFAAVEIKARLMAQIANTGSAAMRKPKQTAPTFAAAATMVLADLEQQKAAERYSRRHEPEELLKGKATKWRLHVYRIEKVLVPALGPLTYAEIGKSAIADMLSKYKKRIEATESEPEIELPMSQSSIGSLSHSYSLVMTKLGELSNSDAPFPRISRRKHNQAEPRDPFDPDELRTILSAMTDDWIEDTKKARNRVIRRALRAYVRFVAVTGIRPGLEVEYVTFGAIVERFDNVSGRHYHAITIRPRQGKYRDGRDAVANSNDPTTNMAQVLADLRIIHGEKQRPDRYLFLLPGMEKSLPDYNKSFVRLITRLGLRLHPGTGNKRTLYSLRHYYANTMIEDQFDITILSKYMGTSTDMIEKYYAHALSRRIQPIIAGVRKTPVERLRAALQRDSLAAQGEPRVEPDEADNEPLEISAA
jgi:hypothetical protein